MNWCCLHARHLNPGLTKQIEMLHLNRKWEKQKRDIKENVVCLFFDKPCTHYSFISTKGKHLSDERSVVK